MKILHCNMNSLPPYHQSGAEITIDEFLEELFDKGHIVYSINSNESTLLRMQKYDKVRKNGLTIINDPFCKVFFNSKDNFEERALKLIREISPDLIISQLNFLRPLAKYCALENKPLLYLIHGVHSSGLNSDTDIECLRSPAVKGIVCMSQFLLDSIHPSLKFKAKVIYPRIPSKRFKTQSLCRRNILFFNPIKSKGIDIVLQLSKEFQNEKFVIRETWGNVLPCTRKGINVEHSITFEKTENVFSKIYSNCKLLLMPSQEAEGLGRGIIEAGLNSIPVLASNNGGIPEAARSNDFLINDYSNYIIWREALKKTLTPSIYAINCQRAFENAMAYKQRYLKNTFSEYIDTFLGREEKLQNSEN
ncbi:MAG: glycosyltransferase family 4 protein [bacterium]|nr:glycosyltransferase family 4 protein [bacterium]